MAKNERIIAQDLAEIRAAIQSQDIARFNEMCEILAKEMQRYPVKPDLTERLEKISKYSDSSDYPPDQIIKEIGFLIDILTSNI